MNLRKIDVALLICISSVVFFPLMIFLILKKAVDAYKLYVNVVIIETHIDVFLLLISLFYFLSMLTVFLILKKFVVDPIKVIAKGVDSLENHQALRYPNFPCQELNMISRAIEHYTFFNMTLAKDKRRLKTSSEIDPLTGLFNRRYLDEFLAKEFSNAKRYQHELHVMMIDIDFFKKINDNNSHQTGDECLKSLARILQYFTRRSHEVAARFGGEEFILVVPGVLTEEAYLLAERIRQEVELLHVPTVENEQVSINFTLSIGISSLKNTQAKSVADLLSYADKALYECKDNGRNQVRVYNMDETSL